MSIAVAKSVVRIGLLPLTFCSTLVLAQDPMNLRRGRGVPTAYSTDQFDSVNLYNGNLSIAIPIGQVFPVSATLSAAISLNYNSNVWDFDWGPNSSVNALPDIYSNAGLGWNLGLARMKLVNALAPSLCTSWILVEADGSRAQIFSTLHPGDTATPACYTRDGSYQRIVKIGTSWKVESPDGNIRAFDSSGRLAAISDRFSGQISMDYSTPNHWKINSSTGAGQLFDVEFETVLGLPERVKSVTVKNFGGSSSTWGFGYSAPTIPRHWKHSSEDEKGGLPSTVQVQLLTSVSRPVADGQPFAMTYFQDNTFDPMTGKRHVSGAISSFRLPTRGKYAYEYRTFSFGTPSSLAPWTAQSDAVAAKEVFSASNVSLGKWEFWQGPRHDGTTPGDPARELRTWVKTPEHGDVTIHYFTSAGGSWKNGLPFSDQIPGGGNRFLSEKTYEGDPSSGSAILVRTGWVRYNADYHASSATGRENQRLESQRVVYDDDGSRYADLSFSSFDGLGHYRTSTTGGNFGAGDVSSNTMNFNAVGGTYNWDANVGGNPPSYNMFPSTGEWVLNRFDYLEISEGSPATSTFRRDFSFDSDTGFLSSVRARKSPGQAGNNDVLAYFCADPATGFAAKEAYFGGDVQSLAGIAPSCSQSGPSGWIYRIDSTYSGGALATRRHMSTNTAGVGHYDYHADIDISTGLPKAVYDVSGYKTKLEFDELGRPTSEERIGDNTATEKGAITGYSYTSGSGSVGGVMSISSTCPSLVPDCSSGASFGEVKLSVDGFGRRTQEQIRQPNGTLSRRDTFWNAMGWMTQQSVFGSNGSGNPAWVFNDFDAFGRPRQINPPDQNAPLVNHQVEFVYTGDRQVARKARVATSMTGSETQVTTTSTFDRQGRLIRIDQPNSAGTLKTTYEYDAAGQLTRVGQGTLSTEKQSRSFSFDGRGFLTSESLPEKVGNVVYSSYDPRGHAHSIQDTGSSGLLALTFDKAERLTRVAEGSSPSRVLKEWTFGSSGAGLGKVATAVRHNYFPAIGNEAIVTETYGYGGAMRLPISRQTQMFISGINQERFDQTFTWNRDGTLASQGYPVCRGADCGAGGPVRTVSYKYLNGFLNEIPGYTDPTPTVAYPITHGPSGLVTARNHLNNVTDNIVPDPSEIPRWSSLTINTPSVALTTGTYAYDGAGNTKTIGDSDYAYDGASRIVSSQLGATPNTQSYSLDVLGNIKDVNTNGSIRPTPTDDLTNRLTNATYDARGNLTDWNGQHYEYDRLNNITRSCATWNGAACTSQDWLHVYTADDERIWQYRLDGTGSHWTIRGLDRKVLRRYETEWASYTDAIWANGALFATTNQSNATTHWHTDELGNPRIATNSAGTVVEQFHPFPYGETGTLATTQVFRFAGHERDLLATSGVADDRDYMHQRSYIPKIARFLSVDPIGGNIGNPQSWNRYAYVIGNPMKFVDPLGLTMDACGGETCSYPPAPPPPTVGPTNGPNTPHAPRPAPGYGPTGTQGGALDEPSTQSTESPCGPATHAFRGSMAEASGYLGQSLPASSADIAFPVFPIPGVVGVGFAVSLSKGQDGSYSLWGGVVASLGSRVTARPDVGFAQTYGEGGSQPEGWTVWRSSAAASFLGGLAGEAYSPDLWAPGSWNWGGTYGYAATVNAGVGPSIRLAGPAGSNPCE